VKTPAAPSTRRKITRLADVAHDVGVSRQTAAKVLHGTGGCNTRVSPETAKRIREAAERLNHRPNPIARQLSGQRSRTLGLIRHHGWSPLISQRAFELETAAYERDFRLYIGHAHGDANRVDHYVEEFLARGVEGAICLLFKPEHIADAQRLIGDRCPTVFDGEGSCLPSKSHPRVGQVIIDVYGAAVEAVEHLSALGRRRIALALGPDVNHPSRSERLRGYREAIARKGIAQKEEIVWTNGDFTDLVDRFIPDNRVDAVICLSDTWAVPLAKQLALTGHRIPEDVAVVGFDNRDVSELTDVTSFDLNSLDVARKTVDLLIRMIESEPLPLDQRIKWIKPRMIVRHSSDPSIPPGKVVPTRGI